MMFDENETVVSNLALKPGSHVSFKHRNYYKNVRYFTLISTKFDVNSNPVDKEETPF